MRLPPLRDDVRTVVWWVALGLVLGAVAGGVVGGVGGRLVMLVLRLASDADGVTSDDGFVIGRFSLFDSLQLYAGMALFGAVNGLAYVLARRFLPRRGRRALWALVGAAVVGAAVVHTDGVDFNVLEPLWFAVAAFVVLPGAAALAVAWLVEESARFTPWQAPRPLALLVVPAAPGVVALPLAAAGAAVAVAACRVRAVRVLPQRRPARLAAAGLCVALIVAGAVDIARDAAEIL
jgi:hypothetical protein